MNSFFLYYVDLFAIVLSVVLAIILTTRTARNNEVPLRKVAAFFMFFGPSAIVVHLSFHILEISYHAVENIIAGSFEYNFRFYSLMLMAAIIIYFNRMLMKQIRNYLQGETLAEVMKTMTVIVFVSLPTVPFTPIGSLPTLACLITLTALPFVKKYKRVVIALR
jgi:hypothetical protein